MRFLSMSSTSCRDPKELKPLDNLNTSTTQIMKQPLIQNNLDQRTLESRRNAAGYTGATPTPLCITIFKRVDQSSSGCS